MLEWFHLTREIISHNQSIIAKSKQKNAMELVCDKISRVY